MLFDALLSCGGTRAPKNAPLRSALTGIDGCEVQQAFSTDEKCWNWKVHQMFQLFDKDKDGVLNYTEITACVAVCPSLSKWRGRIEDLMWEHCGVQGAEESEIARLKSRNPKTGDHIVFRWDSASEVKFGIIVEVGANEMYKLCDSGGNQLALNLPLDPKNRTWFLRSSWGMGTSYIWGNASAKFVNLDHYELFERQRTAEELRVLILTYPRQFRYGDWRGRLKKFLAKNRPPIPQSDLWVEVNHVQMDMTHVEPITHPTARAIAVPTSATANAGPLKEPLTADSTSVPMTAATNPGIQERPSTTKNSAIGSSGIFHVCCAGSMASKKLSSGLPVSKAAKPTGSTAAKAVVADGGTPAKAAKLAGGPAAEEVITAGGTPTDAAVAAQVAILTAGGYVARVLAQSGQETEEPMGADVEADHDNVYHSLNHASTKMGAECKTPLPNTLTGTSSIALKGNAVPHLVARPSQVPVPTLELTKSGNPPPWGVANPRRSRSLSPGRRRRSASKNKELVPHLAPSPSQVPMPARELTKSGNPPPWGFANTRRSHSVPSHRRRPAKREAKSKSTDLASASVLATIVIKKGFKMPPAEKVYLKVYICNSPVHNTATFSRKDPAVQETFTSQRMNCKKTNTCSWKFPWQPTIDVRAKKGMALFISLRCESGGGWFTPRREQIAGACITDLDQVVAKCRDYGDEFQMAAKLDVYPGFKKFQSWQTSLASTKEKPSVAILFKIQASQS